jgi:hypothetical protein
MRILIAGLLLLAAAATNAQEGFPLDGTWRSETTAADGSHRTIVLVMQWDGKVIGGTMNPGPEGTDFTTGKLNPEGWKFTLDLKTKKGSNVHFDAAISNLGKYDRVLSGKWTEGGRTSDVRFVRE